MPDIFPNSSASALTLSIGDSVNLTWNATADLGIFFYEGDIQKPDGSYHVFTRRFQSGNPLPVTDVFNDTPNRGNYHWTSRYADTSIDGPGPYTYGGGFKDQIIDLTVIGLAQPTPGILPNGTSCVVGDTVNFSAIGGAGTGDYVWFGIASGTGATKSVTFPLAGTYQVKLYRNGDLTYEQSPIASINVIVGALPVENPVFNPVGGSYSVVQLVTISSPTSGALIRYVTDNSTPSSTTGILYTSPVLVAIGTTIKAIAFLGGHPNSAVVSATYDIPPPPPIVNIDSTVQSGIAPISTTISWTALNATSVVVSGPNLSSASASGSKLFSNLDVGSYVFSIMAFNAGGSATSSITVSALTSTIDFIILGTKTVQFYDRTIYRADSWLWDFGDGNTSTEENPIHTYGFDGIFVVKLTAWCDGKESVIIHTVSVSGCFSADPLPFTPDWELLTNEQDYPAWDDPRFAPGSASNNELGFVASREGVDNPNWEMCSYLDWCYGPAVVGTPEFRFKIRWITYLDPTTKVWSYGKGVPNIGVPLILFPEQVSNLAFFNNVNFVSLSFDENSKAYFAFQKGTNQVQIRYFASNGTQTVVSFTGETPKLFGEVNIQPATVLADVCCFYLRNGTVYVRFQRESFSFEHPMQMPSIYGSELAVLTKVDDIRDNDVRRVYLYGYTLGHRKILLKSSQYPVFPSDTPTHVDVEDHAAESVTLIGGHDYVASLEFSELLIGMMDGYTTDRQEPATQTTTLEVGNHPLADLQFATQQTGLTSGFVTYRAQLGTQITTIDNGNHPLADLQVARETFTLDYGINRQLIHKVISQISIDQGGSLTRRVEKAITMLSLGSGTHALHIQKTVSAETLDRGSHARRIEQVVSRETFDRGKHRKGDTGSGITVITLNGANHRVSDASNVDSTVSFDGGTHSATHETSRFRGTIDANFTFERGSHHRDQEFSGTILSDFTLQNGSYVLEPDRLTSYWFTLNGGTHARPLDNILAIQPTIDNGSHLLYPDPSSGTTLVSLGSGVHYFQLLTFDYDGSDPNVIPEQDDHWDSTNRFFDLDIVIQPDIA